MSNMSKTPSFLECISFYLVLVILASVLPQRMAARDISYRYGGHTIIYTVLSEENRTCETKAGRFNENGTITSGNDVSGAITIPEIIEDTYGYSTYTVVRIGDGSFSSNVGLRSIKLPNSVKQIGQWAFSSCSRMEEISLPDSLQSIDKGAFSGCNKLKNFEMPFSVLDIGSQAFSACSELTKFILSHIHI